MKKYIFDIHYDMVINVEVMADNEQEAAQIAKEQAARLPMEAAECVDQDACLTEDPQELTAQELRRMEHEAVTEFVQKYIGYCVTDINEAEDSDSRKAFAAKLSGLAYGLTTINWLAGVDGIPSDHPRREWLRELFRNLSEGNHPEQALYDRYARMYARQKFDLRYKNTAKSPFAARVEGLSKEQKKQAFTEAVGVLCDRMEYYVMHQDDEDCKVWEPQMIVRYDFGRDEHGHDDYWNLFVYCHGPNDQDGRDCYELATAWQHVHCNEDGRDDTDDYGTEFHQSRADLLRTLFYKDAPQFEETDEEPAWHDIESVWVD